MANLVSDISCFVELPWCMELPTKDKDLGLYEAASVQLSSDILNVVNQQQHTFKSVEKGELCYYIVRMQSKVILWKARGGREI